jgi:sporulation protein YlmC with PRC-barrel domain
MTAGRFAIETIRWPRQTPVLLQAPEAIGDRLHCKSERHATDGRLPRSVSAIPSPKGTTMAMTSGHTGAIRATKVIGTSVYNPSGDKIGKVEDVVLDKTSNNIMFAVVGFGGFLGMNEKFHPLPWSTLDYQKGRDGYVVNMTKEQLQAAPSDGINELTRGDGNSALRDEVYDYYKAPRYWQ